MLRWVVCRPLLVGEGTEHVVQTGDGKDKLGVSSDVRVSEVETVRDVVPQLGHHGRIRVTDCQAGVRPQFCKSDYLPLQ